MSYCCLRTNGAEQTLQTYKTCAKVSVVITLTTFVALAVIYAQNPFPINLNSLGTLPIAQEILGGATGISLLATAIFSVLACRAKHKLALYVSDDAESVVSTASTPSLPRSAESFAESASSCADEYQDADDEHSPSHQPNRFTASNYPTTEGTGSRPPVTDGYLSAEDCGTTAPTTMPPLAPHELCVPSPLDDHSPPLIPGSSHTAASSPRSAPVPSPRSAPVPSPRSAPVAQTLDHLLDIIPPIITAFGKAAYAMGRAHAHVTQRPPPDQHYWDDSHSSSSNTSSATSSTIKSHQIHLQFHDMVSELQKCLCKPELYLKELVRYFGRGKNKPSLCLRRLIAAHNTYLLAPNRKNKNKFHEVLKQNKAVARGNNLEDVVTKLRSETTDAVLLEKFPSLMTKHFSLDDKILQTIGEELLNEIFSKTQSNPIVLQALQELRYFVSPGWTWTADMKACAEKLEHFLLLVYEEANLEQSTLQNLSARVINHMIQNQVMRNVRKFLGMLARNMRLLPLMLQKDSAQSTLFPQIDQTFLLSESSDCFGGQEEIHTQLIALQSQINLNRKPNNRIAFILLNQGHRESVNYTTLQETNEVVKLSFEINEKHFSIDDLQAVNACQDVKDLATRLGKQIVAVPVSISEHQFKQMRIQQESFMGQMGIKLANFFRSWVPGFVKPTLFNMLPYLNPPERATFNDCFDQIINVLFSPVFDGAIAPSGQFQTIFATKIKTVGGAFATAIESRLKATEELSFADICALTVRGLNDLTSTFSEVYNERPTPD